MTAYGIIRRSVRLLGSPWGFYPVAVVALFAHGVGGHPLDALPFLFEWALVVGACHWIGKWLPTAAPLGLPANRSFPAATLAVSITPTMPPETSPEVAAMKDRLPANVARLLQ